MILDPEAVRDALAGYSERPDGRNGPTDAFADALLANERLKIAGHPSAAKSFLETDIADLVSGGVKTLWNLIRR